MAEIDPYAFTNAFNQQVQMGQQKRAYQNQLAQQDVENQSHKLRDMYLGEQQQWARDDRAQQQQVNASSRRDQAAVRVGELSRRALSLGDPAQMRGFLQQAIPTFAEDFSIIAGKPANVQEMLSVPDEQLAQVMQQLAAFGQPQEKWTDVQGPRGTLLQQNSMTGEKRQVVAQQPSQPASLQRLFITLSPNEVQERGFPAGTVVQQDANTGELNVVTKRDNTGSLSQKDMTTARMKINTVQLARQQLQTIKDRFKSGTKGMDFFGPVAGRAGTPAGNAFDAAVDQMRSTLTSLTRVPGVGAMSDYETRLDQAKFPKRTDWENVTQQKIQGLEDMLTTIERGYSDLLGAQGQQSQPSAPVAVDVNALLDKYAPRQ
jgi:hypothetical protein